jgi:hypothetical protein
MLDPKYIDGDIWLSPECADQVVCLDWRINDPLLFDNSILPKKAQVTIAYSLNKAIKDDEKLVVEVHPDNWVDIMLYSNNNEYIMDALGMLEDRHQDEYDKVIRILDVYDIDIDFMSLSKMEYLPRTMSYDYALQLYSTKVEQNVEILDSIEEYQGLTEEDINEINKSIMDDIQAGDEFTEQQKQKLLEDINLLEY